MSLAKFFLILGAGFLLIGLVLLVAPRIPWLGRLPGDIHWQRGQWSFYAPLATSLIFSVVLTLVLNIWKFFK